MDLLADLTDAQREAVTHTTGPLLVLAGVNMLIFHSLVGLDRERIATRIAGAVSLLIWICVIAFGRWTGFTIHATPLLS